MSEIPITVYDCGVFLQGLLSKAGPAVACLELVEQDRIRLVMSEAVLGEIKDVLSRPLLRERNPNLTDEKVENLIDLILERAEFVENVPPHFSCSRDPNDDQYLNLAIETEAVFLVSRDNDLLDLMTDFTAEARDFRRRHRRIKVLDPVKFLEEIRKLESKGSVS
ncbi:MAG: putative toxin-antitoxin system toxin component, PIN family [Acidobacteria bacterium]|nr:putative toxin-antitoxin system toxin component, PIN family [Acidobacteriota bacterium]